MTGKLMAMLLALGLSCTSLGLIALRPTVLAASSMQMPTQMQMPGNLDQGVPSYHAYALKPPIPATLDSKQFPDALNRNVYQLAGKIRPVLYQQPCYCYCDRSVGHKSLLDCFASAHGTQCDICQREAVFSYQQTQKGKTPAQIRAAIIRGDWKTVDMQPYLTATLRR